MHIGSYILFSHDVGYTSTICNYDLIRCMLTLPDQLNIPPCMTAYNL